MGDGQSVISALHNLLLWKCLDHQDLASEFPRLNAEAVHRGRKVLGFDESPQLMAKASRRFSSPCVLGDLWGRQLGSRTMCGLRLNPNHVPPSPFCLPSRCPPSSTFRKSFSVRVPPSRIWDFRNERSGDDEPRRSIGIQPWIQ